MIERLIGKGYDIRLYDRNVRIASLVGANRDYILNAIPHISNLMVENTEDVVNHADIIVIGNGDDEFLNVVNNIPDNKVIVDLVRVINARSSDSYDGICW